MRNSGVPARGVRALESAGLMTPIGVLEGFLVGFHLFFLRHFLDRLGPVSLSGLRLGSFVFGIVVHSQMGAKATYYSSFCATARSARLFSFAHRLILVSFASDTMPEEHNFLHHITGSFAQPAAENPTVEMVEAAYRHHGLHYRYPVSYTHLTLPTND